MSEFWKKPNVPLPWSLLLDRTDTWLLRISREDRGKPFSDEDQKLYDSAREILVYQDHSLILMGS